MYDSVEADTRRLERNDLQYLKQISFGDVSFVNKSTTCIISYLYGTHAKQTAEYVFEHKHRILACRNSVKQICGTAIDHLQPSRLICQLWNTCKQ